ncbi:MAG: DUF554 domain-containing protein [Oscillospiraceae bacterium]|nr:DUF554 domain-containing protein [Oscillospiraceae bacterium]
MIGLGTIINCASIVAGGVLGMLFGKFVSERLQDGLTKVCGVSTLFIGICGALEKMLKIEGAVLTGSGTMLVVICLALGTLVGEILNIEAAFERFGDWLKKKTGNAKDGGFTDAFVTASLTVCIGAMAIVGAIEDGLTEDYSVLAAKAVLDLIIILIMTCAMGKGCMFSAIPVGLWQGLVTVLARLMQPLMTESALGNVSMIGSVLIFCVGVNLVWGKKLRVANMLPAVLFAIIAAFLPI